MSREIHSRRAIEASEATLDASVEQYDDVLVTLLGDVATNYVQYRTVEQRIAYAQENVRVQQKILELATARFKGGMTSELDVNVGIPADLLRRRPDVRRAEREAAAQSAQIGVET